MEHYPSWAVEQVWGSDRFYHEGDVAEDQYAFVIDSGVDLLDDLNVVEEWSRSWVHDRTPFDSGKNNHGTRVASIIGAKANYEGLTGVASTDNIITGTAATFNNTANFNSTVNIAGLTTVGVMTVTNALNVTGVITATSFEGSGALLTGLPAGFTELDAALFN